MRKTIIAVALSSLVICGYSQGKKAIAKANKVNVPEAVMKAFASQFPKAAKVKWSLEKPGEYEAEFDFNRSEMSVVYNDKGSLIETETEIRRSELPQAVQSALIKDFAGYKFDEFEKAEAKGVITYEMEAKKGKVLYELIFDGNGKLLKKVEEKTKN
jgi:Protein of unknown function (DUF2874).